jgi:integrase
MSQTSQYPAVDGIYGPYPTKRGNRYGVRIKGYHKEGFRTKADAIYKRDQFRTDKYEQKTSPEKFQARRSKKITIADLLQLVVDDFKRNNLASLKDALEHQRFWVKFKGSVRASTVTGSTLKTWGDEMLKMGLCTATVNRKVSKLLRGYTIATLEEEPPLLYNRPAWKKLGENNPRPGFVENANYHLIRDALPMYVRVPLTIGYWCGMRKDEIFGIQWSQVTFNDLKQTVRMQLAETKNGESRQVVMSGDMYTTLRAWREETKDVCCAYVCQRNGRPLKSIEDIWNATCIRLGLGTGRFDPATSQYREYKGVLFHDLRRTMVRNMESAGVSRERARRISGHKTDSVYSRYNIVNEADLEDAGRKVVAYIGEGVQ